MKKIVYYLLFIIIFSCASREKTLMQQISLSDREDKDYFQIGLNFAQSYEASKFLNKNDFNNAIKNFRRVISDDKNNYVAWYNIARLYFYEGNYSNSRKSLVKTLEINNTFLEAYILYVKTYLLENNFNEANGLVQKVKDFMPNDINVRYLNAFMLFKNNKVEESINEASEIIKSNPSFTQAYILLGNIYFTQGKLELARLIYIRAIEVKGYNPSLYSNLGLINLDLNEKNEALNNLKTAVDKAPASSYSYLNLSKFYIEAGDYEGALNQLRIAISIYPIFSEAYNNMGLAYMKLSLYEDARKSFIKSINIDDKNADAYFNYGILLDDYFSDSDKALENYNKYISLKGSDIESNDIVFSYIKTIEMKKIRKERTK